MKVKNKLGMSLVMKIYGVWSSSSALLLAKNDYNFQFSCSRVQNVSSCCNKTATVESCVPHFNPSLVTPIQMSICS